MKKILIICLGLIANFGLVKALGSPGTSCQVVAKKPSDCNMCNYTNRNSYDNYDACLQATSCQAVAKKFSDCNMCNYTNRDKYDNHDACLQATACQIVAENVNDCNQCNTNNNGYDKHDTCVQQFTLPPGDWQNKCGGCSMTHTPNGPSVMTCNWCRNSQGSQVTGVFVSNPGNNAVNVDDSGQLQISDDIDTSASSASSFGGFVSNLGNKLVNDVGNAIANPINSLIDKGTAPAQQAVANKTNQIANTVQQGAAVVNSAETVAGQLEAL